MLQLGRVGLVLALAAAAGGCFQPLYGARSPSGSPALRDALSAIDVQQIDAVPNTPIARIAVPLRNELIFSFTGGGEGTRPTHRLKVQLTGRSAVVAASSVTGLPVIENYTLDATYSLIEVRTNRAVVTGRATTTVSYDPSGIQRFARISGMQDAEERAAKVIAENLTTRMASYFISGS
ncbi:MAG: LPS assembly lipoprotein LptE [Xanthobacteraceae bacterium]